MSVFNKIFNSRDKPRYGARNKTGGGIGGFSGLSFLFGQTSAGKVVNERSAMQTTAVFACVKVISEAIAELPCHVYRYVDNDNAEKAHEHALYRLLHLAPNEEMTAYTFIETAMTHLLLYGNFYCQVIRDGRGFPLALYPLLPANMTVSRDTDTKRLVYTYRADGGDVKLSQLDVLHVPGLGFDGLVGYSPIALAKNSIGMAIATEEYGSAFFKNGANPGGVLEFPGTVNDIPRVKEAWNAGFQGTENAHRIGILEEGARFNPISVPPEEAQFLQTRRYQLEEISRIYRVPLHLVGDLEHATFSNIEHQSLSFVKFTLMPWVRRLELAFEKALLLPSEQGRVFVKFSVEGLLRGDFKSRYEGYAIGRQNGWLSVNDIRRLENLNTVPAELGGDDYHLNGNMLKLGEAGAAYAKLANMLSEKEKEKDGEKPKGDG